MEDRGESSWSQADLDTLRRLVAPPLYLFSNEFRSLLEELLQLITEYGITKVPLTFGKESSGFDNDDHRDRFVGAVHEGWKKAQARILHAIRERIPLKQRCKDRQRQAHRERQTEEKAKAARDYAVCSEEILVLRRLLDSICWFVLQGQHHIVRRLHLDGKLPEITVEQIDYILPVLEMVNEPQLVMAVACDATTFIHTSDLLIADRRPAQAGIAFVEVKSGKKNIEMSKKALFAAESNCPRYEAFATAEMNAIDLAHFARAKRQASRVFANDEIFRTGAGIDHRTGMQVHTPEPTRDLESFGHKLEDCCGAISQQQRWAIGEVDQCLYFGAYGDRRMIAGFLAWIKPISVGPPRLVNLLDSFRDPLARPLLASYLSPHQVRRILLGEVTLLMALDIERWIQVCNQKLGDRFFIETKAESRKVLNNAVKGSLIEHNGRLIGMRQNSNAMYFGEGMLARMFFDFQSPISLAAYTTHQSEPSNDPQDSQV